MADQKTYSIRIDGVTESIKDVGTLGDAINGLGSKANGGAAGLNELGKATQKLNSFNREYQTALQSVKAELAAKNKEVKQAVDYDSALLTIEANIRDSYRDKQNLLSALGTAIKSMNTETDGQKQRQAELIQQYNELNNELKEMDAAMGNHQRNVGNYEAATVGLKQQLADMKAQMADMLANGVSKADPAFVELAKKAGALKDAIGDAGEEINRFASDTKSLDNVISVAESATAAFGLFKGAMSAFGMETEEADKAIQQLAGAMSIIQSLKTLQEQLEKGGAAAKMMNGAMKVLTLGIKGTTTATKALRIALASIGIGIVIALLTTLIANWEKIYGWFQKTFPVLNNLGAKFKALGKAIQTGVIDTLKTLAGGLKQLFSGDFSGAWETLKKGFKDTLSDMKDSYSKDFQESMTKKQLEESVKRRDQQLKELAITERNNKTYSKRYIDLQKKQFEERKRLAKGNKEELNKIKLEEMDFFAKVEDKKTALAKKGAADRAKAEAEAKKEEEKRQKELEKRVEEVHSKANDISLKTEEADTQSNISYVQEQIRIANEVLKEYVDGPLEAYEEHLSNIVRLQVELLNLQKSESEVKLADELEDALSVISLTSEELENLFNLMNEEGEEAAAKYVDEIVKSRKETADLSNEVTRQMYNNDENSLKLFIKKEKAIIEDHQNKEAQYRIDSEKKMNEQSLHIIETTADVEFYKYKETQDKKSDAAKRTRDVIIGYWNDYVLWAAEIYGTDTKNFIDAVEKRKKALKELKEEEKKGGRGNSAPSFFGYSAEWGDSETQDFFDKLARDTRQGFDMMFQGVFDPIANAFGMMLEFAIEEAQEALDKATEMHDKAVEKVTMSQDKISELNDKLRNSSGSQLEAYKEQMADEQALLLQREAEEKRLAKEKEKREKELEKKKKQQERLNMAMNLMEAIANTAVGVTSALKWGPILGPIFAAIIGAMGAVQIALITKQLSKMADGGLLQGPSHAQGGIPVGNTGIEVEGNEYVVNKRSTAKYLPLLQAINEEGARHKTRANQIGKFADGGTINAQRIASNFSASNDQVAIQQAIEAIDLHPVVEVVQIAKGLNNLSTVREIAGGGKLLNS